MKVLIHKTSVLIYVFEEQDSILLFKDIQTKRGAG